MDYLPLLKKDVKKNSNITCLAIILYTLASFLVVILDEEIHILYLRLTYEAEDYYEAVTNYINQASDSAWSTMIGILFGLVIIYFFARRENIKSLIFSKNKNMDVETFIGLLFVFMAPQLIFSYLSSFIESGMNMIGYTTQSDLEWSTDAGSTFSMFIYASFFAPVCEEIVYRGYVMRNMQRYGKSTAIIFSAVMFGIMHGNIHQIFFAFTIGLVLGYVAMEYSIKWSIALHMINNFVFGDLMDWVLSRFPDSVYNVISTLVLFAFLVGGIYVIVKNMKNIKIYFSTLNIKHNKTFKWIFASPAFIVFAAFCVLEVLMGIEKL